MKRLIFDVGGVLVYPRLGEWHLPLRVAEVLGSQAHTLHSSRYLLAHRQAARWLDESQRVPDVEAERRLRQEYLRELNQLMEWQLSAPELLLLADDFTDNIRRYGFFDDVEPWLRRWRGAYGLGLLSDAMPSILKFLDQRGLLGLFDAAVISTQVGATKPDPRMYAAILAALDARPEDCLFVDDRPANLEGAVAAGMRAVQMARSAFLPETLWDGPVVRGFEGLNALLEAGKVFGP